MIHVQECPTININGRVTGLNLGPKKGRRKQPNPRYSYVLIPVSIPSSYQPFCRIVSAWSMTSIIMRACCSLTGTAVPILLCCKNGAHAGQIRSPIPSSKHSARYKADILLCISRIYKTCMRRTLLFFWGSSLEELCTWPNKTDFRQK